jgi:hypothetical protein
MGRRDRSSWPKVILALPTLGAVALAVTIIGAPRPAEALPSFARQTGQPCGQCHTDYPGLTPFGRRFKLGGYTLGGGDYRTTPFPTSTESGAGRASGYAATGPQATPAQPDTSNLWFPPISMMAIVGLTHTQAPLPPPTEPYSPNNNVVVDPVSFFWGGAITEHIGAFAQLTYAPPGPGGLASPPSGDPFGHTWGWDNIDVRYANTTKVGPLDILYGISANNNPSVQDPWNTTPAWTFPYAASSFSAGFGPSTIIDGTFAAHVVGTGGYLWINDLLYLEATAYHTPNFKTLDHLGADPFDIPGRFDVAPYWRVAFEPHWGNHWLMFGTFGMYAAVHPWLQTSPPFGDETFGPSDKFTDIGLDSQYQYQGDNFWLTLRGSFIHEHQRLDASVLLGSAANPTNELNTLRLYASLAYGNDNKIVLTGQYFNTWGTSDTILFSPDNGFGNFSPNADGWIGEIAYIPFGTSRSPLWPWFNARIALQYTWYNKFNGTTVNAHDNNTLFLHAWFAM